MTSLAISNLNNHYQTLKPTMPDAVRLRVHRALSWLEQAERTTDLDTRFIFLWIAFNAIYAKISQVCVVRIRAYLLNFYTVLVS